MRRLRDQLSFTAAPFWLSYVYAAVSSGFSWSWFLVSLLDPWLASGRWYCRLNACLNTSRPEGDMALFHEYPFIRIGREIHSSRHNLPCGPNECKVFKRVSRSLVMVDQEYSLPKRKIWMDWMGSHFWSLKEMEPSQESSTQHHFQLKNVSRSRYWKYYHC